MKKRSKPVSVNVKLTYPKSSQRFRCRVWGETGETYFSKWDQKTHKRYGWIIAHHPKDGDELVLCQFTGCQRVMCREHYSKHEEEHILDQLGG